MENAVDALKMAAAILIFIIAIASSFSLFGTAKQTADSIITMRDRQTYIEAAGLEGIFYTSSSGLDEAKFTQYGDRIVGVGDVISTIYRYNKEKYGVTIIEKSGNVIARYDSNTENLMRQYNNIESAGIENYVEKLKKNISTIYVPNPEFELETLYKISVTGNSNIQCGAPWYGNDEEIQKRINADIHGEEYEYNGQRYNIDGEKNLLSQLTGKQIVEVTNEIDQSKYLEDNGQTTNLLQQYNMPTVEIVYVILN